MQGKVKTDNTMPAVYVGIDVSKEHLDIYLHPLGEHFAVANDAGGWRHLLRRLTKLTVALVVLEPTSKYHRATHRHLHAAEIPTALINPLRARLFAQACGERAKTDRIDARMLALFGERMAPGIVAPPTLDEEELEELASARSTAIAERVAMQNRLGITTTTFLRRELSIRLRSLTAHIKRLEQKIEQMIAADPRMARRSAILRSIPGIGPVATLAILSGLREIGTLTAKQAAALAGLAPYPRDSGSSHKPRFIRGGRSSLRTALYMAALVASRHNPSLADFYKHLRENGKPAKVALTAIARKIIVLANSLVAQNRNWMPIPA